VSVRAPAFGPYTVPVGTVADKLADGEGSTLHSLLFQSHAPVLTRASRRAPMTTWNAQKLTVTSLGNRPFDLFLSNGAGLVRVTEARSMPAPLYQRAEILLGSCC